jgi:hypothetical protein
MEGEAPAEAFLRQEHRGTGSAGPPVLPPVGGRRRRHAVRRSLGASNSPYILKCSPR